MANPASGHSYRVTKGGVTIDQAHELARLAGGTLLCLESGEEEAWVRSTFGAKRTWLGLVYPHEVWESGAEVEYTHWNEGEPSHGDREPCAVANWNAENGAWNDVTGGPADSFQAVIELESHSLEPKLTLPPRTPPPGRGALLLCVEGLTRADLEHPAVPHLEQLLASSAHSFAAAASPGGERLSGWGLLGWGVGPGKSELDPEKPPETNYWLDMLQTHLERAWEESTTAWIVDDEDLTRRIALGGKMDLRVWDPRGGSDSRRARALAHALSGPAPSLVTVGWKHALDVPPGARKKALEEIDAELGLVLASLRARAEFEREDWLIVLTAPAPPASAARNAGARRKKGPEPAVPEVPLVLHGGGFQAGELRFTVGLADVVPTLARHVGLPLSRGWLLDGRPLQDHPAADFDVDLLVNGDAEAQFGWSGRKGWLVPGWRSDGSVGTRVYRARELSRTAPGPASRGRSFFRGSERGPARMEQLVDVSALAGDVDAKAVRFRLSGWLGGTGESDHQAGLELASLDGDGNELETWQIEPLDRSARRKALGAEKGLTRPGLLERELRDDLPAKTRVLRVALVFTGNSASHEAAADELHLVLERKP